MNLPAPWKKPLYFGLFGAIGCLAGWLIGEPLLAIAIPSGSAEGRAPSLIARPQPPALAPPPLPAEFRDREALANAKSGDLQFSLIWDNANDLDLICVDPTGFQIFFNQRRSPSGGELDVDRHAGCGDLDPKPAENIYWAANSAPFGRYQVLVHHYQNCGSAPVETPYKATALIGSQRLEFSGTLRQVKAINPIHEFNLAPELKAFAPDKADLVPNSTLTLPIAIQRTFCPGPITAELLDPPPGVSAAPITIPAGADTADLNLVIDASASLAAPRAARIRVSNGAASSQASIQMAVIASTGGGSPGFSLWLILVIGLWTALLATGLALLLMIGQNRYLNRPLFAGGWPKIAVGSALAGFVSGALGQALFYLLLAAGLHKLGFLVGWILLGALVSRGVSLFIPNLAWRKAMVAGVVGGFFGAAAFLIASQAAEGAGRFIGAGILGFCIGLMMAIAEAAFRRAWLEVSHGPREISMVTLGPEPVAVGGDHRRCAIWVNGAPDVALRYWVRNNQVLCADPIAQREDVVPAGHSRKVGKVELTVRTAADAPAQAQAPKPLIPPSRPESKPRASVPPPLPSSAMASAPSPAVSADRDPPLAPKSAPSTRAPEIIAPPTSPQLGKEIFAPPTTPLSPPPPPVSPIPRSPEILAPPTSPLVGKEIFSPPTVPLSPPLSPPPPISPPPPSAPPPPSKFPDVCPICKRPAPGKPGSRYCLIDEITF